MNQKEKTILSSVIVFYKKNSIFFFLKSLKKNDLNKHIKEEKSDFLYYTIYIINIFLACVTLMVTSVLYKYK